MVPFKRLIIRGGNMKLIGIVISSLIFISSAHALDLTAQSGEKVYFRGWQYRTDIVQSNIDRYNDDGFLGNHRIYWGNGLNINSRLNNKSDKTAFQKHNIFFNSVDVGLFCLFSDFYGQNNHVFY